MRGGGEPDLYLRGGVIFSMNSQPSTFNFMKTGQLMNFSLYGGPADGGLVCYPLQEAGAVYLIAHPWEEGRREVHAYSFADRTDAAGNWVLRWERFIGWQGMPPGK